MKRDLLSFAFWNADDIARLLERAAALKTGRIPPPKPLNGQAVALVFEQESLRTRVSFEVGIAQLGGYPTFLQQETIGIATRESVHDIAQVLSVYCALVIARTTRHQTCVQLAESATIPVINAMTDLVHPCQVLADALTLRERGKLSPSTKIVFLGHGNNMANSWLELARKVPLHLVLSCPDGFDPNPRILEEATEEGVSRVELVHDPAEAVRDAGVLYTDVWPSGGSVSDASDQNLRFRPFQVNRGLVKRARPDCIVMHRLPAHRGEEITGEILDGKHSVVLEQARNRVPVQMAAMIALLGGQ